MSIAGNWSNSRQHDVGDRTRGMNLEQPDPDNTESSGVGAIWTTEAPGKNRLSRPNVPGAASHVAIDDLGCIASQADERGCVSLSARCAGRLATKSVSLLEIKSLLVGGARLIAHAPRRAPRTQDWRCAALR
jgi:hypothetical protein